MYLRFSQNHAKMKRNTVLGIIENQETASKSFEPIPIRSGYSMRSLHLKCKLDKKLVIVMIISMILTQFLTHLLCRYHPHMIISIEM